MSSPAPPQPPLSWSHTPAELIDLTKSAIAQSRATFDSIAALSNPTFHSVFLPIAHCEAAFDTATSRLAFYQNVSTSKELRDASNESEKLTRDYEIEKSMRLDIYEAMLKAKKHVQATGQTLTPEESKLMNEMIRDGKRSGLALPEAERENLKELRKDLAQTCLEFTKNFNEENGTIEFTLEELKGVPNDVVSGYSKKEGSSETYYSVTFKTPDIFPIFQHAQNPDTRRRAYQAYESRLEINVPLLKKVLDLRRRCADILGYKTWADFVEEPMMIKTGRAVIEFLDNLEQRLRPVGLNEVDTLLQLKKEEEATHKYPNAPPTDVFYLWDYRYFDRLFIEKSLDLDDSLVKEYFPVDVTVSEILKTYQSLLGVRFEEAEGETWHPDVQHFTVWNASDNEYLGSVYLDLYPREAKYSHAAVFPLLGGYAKEDGSRNYPVCAMVANLSKPTPSKPALMRHDDVVTFFHEMGHVFHELLSKTRFSRFHGFRVARDFVEAPSQMLENWCWDPSVIKKMSSHYVTKKPLSDELIEKLIKSRFVNVGLFFLRQIFFGKFDIKVHTETPAGLFFYPSHDVDYSKMWCDMRETISLVKTGDKITPGQGSFGHIVGGYDAGYYGYAYSLVYAYDMFETVFANDPMSPAAGKRYRDEILLPGASRDEMESLKAFLKREPNADALLKKILGKRSASSAAEKL
ncbi:hypothetical protein BOTBODRAFT_105721 [Botryobasidium botryosum FD-172 SS1]|uniref:Peptidase M3A/M3B catalytic domain-containing protein n=1 Tax=Botryobasidium botryosum (strain FD-172 SS1) TaxID=930990 RepID=A0A067MNS6_BOTB1|nr:hypothetical protein BOTBODRAFT_105721 [Botryobasidium botryosum FD-172 SS1]